MYSVSISSLRSQNIWRKRLDLKDIVSTFNLTEQEEKMLLNAKVGECLFMCGIRKLYMTFRLFNYELEMIDSKFVKGSSYD